MLDAPELAKRIRAAMDLRKPPLRSIDLARACSTTKQAVYGWRKHGRVAKRHLPIIARETGRPIEFFLEAERGETRATRSFWRRVEAAGGALMLVLATTFGQPKVAQASDFYRLPGAMCIMLNRLRKRLLGLQKSVSAGTAG